MNTHTYSLTFTHVPPGFKRGALAILAIFQNDKLVLSRKHAYPDNVYRLLGGGIDSGESPKEAARRELYEETSLKLPSDRVNHQAQLNFKLNESSTNTNYVFTVELFIVSLENETLVPSDDIDIIDSFTREQAQEKVSLFKNLSTELVSPKKDLNSFRWSDWGELFFTVHQYVIEHWPTS